MKKTIIIFTIIAISLGMATFTTKHFKAQVLSYGSILEKNIVALCDGEDNIPSGFVKVRGQWKGYCWKPTITDSCQCPIDSNCTIKVIQYLKKHELYDTEVVPDTAVHGRARAEDTDEECDGLSGFYQPQDDYVHVGAKNH